MAKDRIHTLLLKFFSGECSNEELEELALWVDTFQNEEEREQQLQEIWEEYEPDEEMEKPRATAIFNNIIERRARSYTERKRIYFDRKILKWAAAAAVAGLILAFSIKYLLPNRAMNDDLLSIHQKGIAEIVPGRNKAKLTLANGQTLFLDSSANGLLANNGVNKVVKISSGVLQLQKEGNRSPKKNTYNTMTTPRGGQYKIILPDGSKVWLNAASSLKFPSSFGEKQRTVFVKGEVYAEIAQDQNRPFVVHILSDDNENQGQIKVLGTAFNINAYPENKRVKTALLSGSIKVVQNQTEKKLHPGQRAFFKEGNIQVEKVDDLDRIVAWKNGQFNFEGNDIRHVMQQIARWYDVEVKYEYVPKDHFVGTISKGKNISEVLNMLEMTGVVQFKIEGRTVTVK